MRKLLLAATLLAAGTAAAFAQNYPDRTVKIIVPYPAGGPTDTVGRTIAQVLTKELGQNVVVENLAGAGGRLAMKTVARSKPDGYTLFLGGTNNNGITPAVYKDLDFEPVKDFAPVAAIASDSLIMVANPQVPAKTLAELIAYAKANPGKVSMGGGIGISPHFIMEFVNTKSGAKMQFVPYRGAAPAMNDAIGGQIQVHASARVLLLPQVKAGKLRALAVASPKRWPELPDTPTLTEAGYPGFPTDIWYGLIAPAGTPAPVVDKLHAVINKGLNTPELKATLAKLGLDPRPMTVKQFGDVLVKEVQIWSDLAKQTGIKLDK
jgi:tripartite-type tricarboxylate transporter receptor subunit TctC